MLGNWIIFFVLSFTFSVATFGSDHDQFEAILLLVMALLTFIAGLTEAIIWAAHPVE